jgi:hypothetical protein
MFPPKHIDLPKAEYIDPSPCPLQLQRQQPGQDLLVAQIGFPVVDGEDIGGVRLPGAGLRTLCWALFSNKYTSKSIFLPKLVAIQIIAGG